MKNKLFDNYVKEQLGAYTPDVPRHIWDNIAAEKDRKKPLGFWGGSAVKIASVLLLTVTAVGIIYFISRNNNVPAVVGNEVSVVIKPTTNEQAIDQTANNTVTQAIPFTNNTSDINNNNPLTPDISSAAHNTNSIYRPGSLFANIHNAAVHNEPNEEQASINNQNANTLSFNFLNAELLRTKRIFNPGINLLHSNKKLSIPCPTAERDAAGNKRYIEIYGGPDYVFSSVSDPSNAAYLQMRKASSRMLFSYSAGIRYTRVFKNGMSIRSGVNYSRINEAFKLEKGHVTQNVYITDHNGDTTGTYTVTGTQYKQNTNKYTSIDVPLVAGYEFGNGRLHTNINAGAIINISSKQSGFVVNANGDAVDVNDKQNTIYRYKTNTGVSLTAGVSFYYKLNEKLHILAEPYIRHSLSPMTQSELTFKQKYNTAGLRLGFRLDF